MTCGSTWGRLRKRWKILLSPRAILNCVTINGKQSKHIVSAPTGAGKSLTFELAPYTFDRLFGEDCNAIVLVIVSLISLMKDQVSNLNSRGIRASYVGDDCSEEPAGLFRGWRVTCGGWRVAGGGWRVRSDGWRVTGDGWRVTGDGLKIYMK